MKRYLYFYIVLLKSYQTAIQYMGKVTLCLEVTPRHDKTLAMHISGFVQKYSFRQHQQNIIEIKYICQYV